MTGIPAWVVAAITAVLTLAAAWGAQRAQLIKLVAELASFKSEIKGDLKSLREAFDIVTSSVTRLQERYDAMAQTVAELPKLRKNVQLTRERLRVIEDRFNRHFPGTPVHGVPYIDTEDDD